MLGPEHSQRLAIADGTQARRDEASRTVGCEGLCGFHPDLGANSNENGVGERLWRRPQRPIGLNLASSATVTQNWPTGYVNPPREFRPRRGRLACFTMEVMQLDSDAGFGPASSAYG